MTGGGLPCAAAKDNAKRGHLNDRQTDKSLLLLFFRKEGLALFD
jgi:hypothetical protein